MTKKIIYFFFATLCFFLTFSFQATAQDFPDEEYLEIDSGVSGAPFQDQKKGAIVELSGISSLGNSDTGSFFLGTEILYGEQGYWVRFDGSTYYAEGSDEVTARNMEGRLELARTLDNRNYVVGRGLLRHDEKQKLDLRSSFGLSFGHNLLRVSYEDLTVEAGIGLQNENFDGPKSSSYAEGQFALKYLFRFSETAAFENRSFYLPSLNRLKDYRIRSEFKLSDTIHNNAGILIRVIFDFDGSPLDGDVNRLDTRVIGGVTYNFLD
ncbi:MAG: DUF481 domain-containing protein [Nitrospinota bacterium]